MADVEGRHYKEVDRALVPKNFVNLNKGINVNGKEYILPTFTKLGSEWQKKPLVSSHII